MKVKGYTIASGADLTEAKLRKANLPKVNLQKANLQKANLCDANLQKAILQKQSRYQNSLSGSIRLQVVLQRYSGVDAVGKATS